MFTMICAILLLLVIGQFIDALKRWKNMMTNNVALLLTQTGGG